MSPRRSRFAWSDKAEEVLSDGRWHNGPALIKELAKLVPPGMALRELEAERVTARAGGAEVVDELAKENPDEHRLILLHRLAEEHPRRSNSSQGLLIAKGQLRIIRIMARERIRSGTWEVRGIEGGPTGDQWRRGNWDLRSVQARTINLTDLATQFQMSTETMRRVLEQYQIPWSTAGRTGRVLRVEREQLPAVEVAVGKFRNEHAAKRTERLVQNRRRSNGGLSKDEAAEVLVAWAQQHARPDEVTTPESPEPPDRSDGDPSHPSTPQAPQ